MSKWHCATEVFQDLVETLSEGKQVRRRKSEWVSSMRAPGSTSPHLIQCWFQRGEQGHMDPTRTCTTTGPTCLYAVSSQNQVLTRDSAKRLTSLRPFGDGQGLACVLHGFALLFLCRLCELRWDTVENELAPLRGSAVMREISTQEVVWPLVRPDTRDEERFTRPWCSSALQRDCALSFHSGATLSLKVVTEKRRSDDRKKKQRKPI